MTGFLEQESKQGQEESGQQPPPPQKKSKKKSVDQAEGMLHLRDIIKTQASDDKKWECHIYPTVF